MLHHCCCSQLTLWRLLLLDHRVVRVSQLYHSHTNVTHRLTPDYPIPRKLV